MTSALVFVDTNVFVYAHDERDGPKQRLARQWIDRLWVEQRGRTSIQVINEFLAAVTRPPKTLLSAEAAWGNVEILLGWQPCALDSALVQRARMVQLAHRISWWDALIVAAARAQGCESLLTEDLHHGAVLDGVRVVDPFRSAVHEEPARYIVEPASRHRPRGRPRKQAATT
jgi:predicted nucleic acid-binding protein